MAKNKTDRHKQITQTQSSQLCVFLLVLQGLLCCGLSLSPTGRNQFKAHSDNDNDNDLESHLTKKGVAKQTSDSPQSGFLRLEPIARKAQTYPMDDGKTAHGQKYPTQPRKLLAGSTGLRGFYKQRNLVGYFFGPKPTDPPTAAPSTSEPTASPILVQSLAEPSPPSPAIISTTTSATSSHSSKSSSAHVHAPTSSSSHSSHPHSTLRPAPNNLGFNVHQEPAKGSPNISKSNSKNSHVVQHQHQQPPQTQDPWNDAELATEEPSDGDWDDDAMTQNMQGQSSFNSPETGVPTAENFDPEEEDWSLPKTNEYMFATSPSTQNYPAAAPAQFHVPTIAQKYAPVAQGEPTVEQYTQENFSGMSEFTHPSASVPAVVKGPTADYGFSPGSEEEEEEAEEEYSYEQPAREPSGEHTGQTMPASMPTEQTVAAPSAAVYPTVESLPFEEEESFTETPEDEKTHETTVPEPEYNDESELHTTKELPEPQDSTQELPPIEEEQSLPAETVVPQQQNSVESTNAPVAANIPEPTEPSVASSHQQNAANKAQPDANDNSTSSDEEEEYEELEEELAQEEREVRRIGGFGVFLALVAMVFTAHQMSENPDGIYARWANCDSIIHVESGDSLIEDLSHETFLRLARFSKTVAVD
ncbi:expressed unknown protein [Seminavis robusta]|uniref:Uncharacterized protein n=1 Tax=Seminavis robusta TaxID=568900 RepID=A0A9N8EZK0_9STRA|nr:expressed unknown protein [Seminavis robusta]|eukprot:Sro2329_g323530.1 n/a (644) ;mRNA; f:7825-9756